MQASGWTSAQATAHCPLHCAWRRPGPKSVSYRPHASAWKHSCVLPLRGAPFSLVGRRHHLKPSCAFLPDFVPQLNPRDLRPAADAIYFVARTVNSVIPGPLRPAIDLLGTDLASTVGLRPSRETLLRLVVRNGPSIPALMLL